MLYGIGGVGKTTLAAEIAHQILDHDPARVPAVLSGELSVDGVFGAVSGALRRHLLLAGAQGPTLRAAEMAGRVDLAWQERFEWLRDHVLDQVPLLVVLDNFEDNLTPEPCSIMRRPAARAVRKLLRRPLTTARKRSSAVISTSGCPGRPRG